MQENMMSAASNAGVVLTEDEIESVAGGFFSTFIKLARVVAAIAPPGGECEATKSGNGYVLACGMPK